MTRKVLIMAFRLLALNAFVLYKRTKLFVTKKQYRLILTNIIVVFYTTKLIITKKHFCTFVTNKIENAQIYPQNRA